MNGMKDMSGANETPNLETGGAEVPVHEAVSSDAMSPVDVPAAPENVPRGVALAVAAWLVPGLGHLLMRRWGKALAYFVFVGALAYAGVVMHGLVFPWAATEVLDRLGFFADLGAGALYLLERMGSTGADLAHASGDYGTRLLATAGILNLLTVLEAYDLGVGRRSE